MDITEFKKQAHEVVDWICQYYENIEDFSVKSKSSPGEIFDRIPSSFPTHGEPFENIWSDFEKDIIPGMTHWQHPHFHAYFNANTSFPSLLGEMVTSALGAQCMIWDTSPAAAELEERMMLWLRDALGLPNSWSGVIQDTASTATLCALLSARERASNFKINQSGIQSESFRVYCSDQAHSSLEKGVKIAGLGSNNLIKVKSDSIGRIMIDELQQAIESDLQSGHHPLFVMAALGTTGTLAVDALDEIVALCTKYQLWLHVDAAYAGSALLLEDFRWMIKGIEQADSFVYNPHKWLFTNFDCTAYYVKDQQTLIHTFEILPEYLKTISRGQVNDYRDWGIPLGRRFRALKLWFVFRSFGLKGLREKIRDQITWTKDLAQIIDQDPDWQVMQEPLFNMIVLRFKPEGVQDILQLNSLNETILKSINQSGEAYLTHTKIDGAYVLRVAFGQTYLEQKHVEAMWAILRNHAQRVSKQSQSST